MAESDKQKILAQLSQQRNEIAKSQAAFTQELSLGRQFKKSLRSNPKGWAIGSAATAFTLCLFFRRKKIIYQTPKKKLIRRTAGLLFRASRPALTAYAINHGKNQLEKYAQNTLNPQEDNSMLGGSLQK